jgi:hypothetical protein
MAYMNQETKREIAPNVKKILEKYNLKGTLSVSHRSALVLTIISGKINFENILNGDSYCSINHYHIKTYPEEFQSLFTEIKNAMNDGNHDNSNAMIDYFDVGWYIEINIGSWKKPYKKI